MLGRSPSWRAALRIARRDAWRNKGRNLLVALLVALPVFAVSVVDVVARTEQLDPREKVTSVLGTTAQALVVTADDSGGRVFQDPLGQGYGSAVGVASEDSSARLRTWQQTEEAVAAALPERDTLVRRLDWYAGPRARVDDRSVYTTWRELDLTAAGLDGLYDVVDGRAPQRAGEVAVDGVLARATGLAVGDRFRSAWDGRADAPAGGAELVVTGIVRTSGDAAGAVYGAPGTLLPDGLGPGDGQASWYVVGPTRVTWDDVLALNDVGAAVTSRAVVLDPPAPDRVPQEARDVGPGTSVTSGAVVATAVAVGLTLLQIALLAGPALAVGARRNQRMLAVVVSTGGERKHARRIVLANGLVVGLVASAVAAVLGAAAAAGLVSWLLRRQLMTAPGVDVHVLDLVGLVLVGGLTAMAAALVPARQAARLDVVAALTGRRPAESVRRHVPVLGALAAAVGIAMSVWGAATRSTVVLVLGIALTQVGLVALSGAVVVLASRPARRLGLAPRMALRDAARQRGRTAPAVAAVMAAIAGGLAALVFVGSQDAHDRAAYQPNLALGAAQVFVTGGDGTLSAAPAELAAAERALRETLPVDTVVPSVRLVTDGTQVVLQPFPAPGQACPLPTDREPTRAEIAAADSDPRCRPRPLPAGVTSTGFGDLVDGDGRLLTAVAGPQDPADVATLRAGKVLLPDATNLWPDGTVRLAPVDPTGTAQPSVDDAVSLPAAVAQGAHRTGGLVVPPSLVGRLAGVAAATEGVVATTTRVPDGDEADRLQAAVEDLAVAGTAYSLVERGYVSTYGYGLLALVGAALVVALVGSLTAVGLARAESRQDASTLAAVGASPGLRRRLAAAQAGVVVGLGTALGTVAGALMGWCLVRLQGEAAGVQTAGGVVTFEGTGSWDLVVPWPFVAALLLGIPALAVGLAFVTTRSRLEVVRQPAF